MTISFQGIDIVPDKPDAWRKVAQAIDRAYGDTTEANQDIRQYIYRQKRLDSMTYAECVTALARFCISTDDLRDTSRVYQSA